MILVVLFFMHVKYATGLTRVVILAGFFWLGIMITLSCSDELTRGLGNRTAGLEHDHSARFPPLLVVFERIPR